MSTTNEQSRAEIVIDTQEMTQKTIDYMRLLEYYLYPEGIFSDTCSGKVGNNIFIALRNTVPSGTSIASQNNHMHFWVGINKTSGLKVFGSKLTCRSGFIQDKYIFSKDTYFIMDLDNAEKDATKIIELLNKCKERKQAEYAIAKNLVKTSGKYPGA